MNDIQKGWYRGLALFLLGTAGAGTAGSGCKTTTPQLEAQANSKAPESQHASTTSPTARSLPEGNSPSEHPAAPKSHDKTEEPPASSEAGGDGVTEDGPTPTGEATGDDSRVTDPSISEPRKEEQSARAKATEVCETLCQRVEEACKDRWARFCRASCKDYQAVANRCPVEVQEVLSCQMNAEPFLLCANIAASNCAPLYRRFVDCREGRAAPQQREKDPAESPTPEGWRRVELAEPGGSFLLPKGNDHMQNVSQRTVVRKKHRFTVEALTDIPQKLTDKAILRVAMNYVGTECQKKLRLHGRFEKGDWIHVRFTTTCADGTPWAGIFHLAPGRGAAASVRPRPGQKAELPTDLETFLFGFELSGAAPRQQVQ